MKKLNYLLLTLLFLNFSYGQNKPYKAAELYTFDAVTYGKFEFRMRVAKGSGILSTFFLYKDGSQNSDTFWEEIDVEVFGKDNAESWQSNIITGANNNNTHSEQVHDTNLDLSSSYHTYTVEWKPDSVVWKFDGQVVRTSTGGQVDDLTNPQSVRFNIWPPTIPAWVGALDTSVLPAHQYVNWIRYYQWNGSDFDASPTWEDDFLGTTLDARWGEATWTFDVNGADFTPDNINLADGYLVLSVTNEGQEGYNGTPPSDPNGQLLSIADFNKSSGQLKVYPLPVQNNLNIEAPVGTSIKLYDINGNVILDSFLIDTPKKALDFSRFASGVYFMEATLGSSKFMKKISKR